MDKETIAASRHSVDFFLILWYYNGPNESQERETNARYLNDGLKTFVNSPEAHRMKFAIEYCNHEPYQVRTEKDSADCGGPGSRLCDIPATSVSVDGRFSRSTVGTTSGMKTAATGQNAAQGSTPFERPRSEAGVGELLLGCGIPSGEKIEAGHPAGELFEFTGSYMEVPDLPQREADYPYEKLAEHIRPARAVHTKDKIPYVPYLGVGFNAKPWQDKRARFTFPPEKNGPRSFAG